MSTKLHHGHRITLGADPFDLIVQARAVLDPVRDRLDAKILAQLATRIIDQATYGQGGHPTPEPTGNPGVDALHREILSNPIWRAFNEYDEEQRKLSVHSFGHDPNRFELAFGRDPDTERIGVLVYTERSELSDAFQALPQVEAYGYWNNTDQPDDVSDAEWADRRTFWDRVLGDGVPIERTLSWVLRGEYDPGMIQMAGSWDGDPSSVLFSQIPSMEERARGIAVQAVLTAGIRGVPQGRITRLLFPLTSTSRYPEVVDLARPLLVEITPEVLLGKTTPAVDDVNAKRAALTAAAEEAAARLVKTDGN